MLKITAVVFVSLLAVSCSKKKGQPGQLANRDTTGSTLEVQNLQPSSVLLSDDGRGNGNNTYTITNANLSRSRGHITFWNYKYVNARRGLDYLSVSDEYDLNEIVRVKRSKCQNKVEDSVFSTKREQVGYNKAQYTSEDTKVKPRKNACYAFRVVHETSYGPVYLILGTFKVFDYRTHESVILSNLNVSEVTLINR